MLFLVFLHYRIPNDKRSPLGEPPPPRPAFPAASNGFAVCLRNEETPAAVSEPARVQPLNARNR
jgi:hypothetical protein